MARSTYPLLLATYALLIVGANGLTLIQHLAATADLAELAKSVNTSSYNLYDTWNQMGPFTVFGPRNASFTVASVAEKVKALDAAASAGNPAGIQALINGHIVYGAYPAATLTNGLTMQTISGQTLTVYNTGTGSIYIDNMLVVSADATVSKDSQTSYVHITDAVNFPPTSMPSQNAVACSALVLNP